MFGTNLTMNEIQSLSSLAPQVVIVALFLGFLLKKQTADDKQRAHTEAIIENHIKENTKGMNNFADKIKDLTDIIEKMETRLSESAEIIKQLYKQNYKLVKKSNEKQ